MSTVEDTIAQCEDRRCRALVEKDLNALSALMPDELIHVHANGHVENKSSYLTTVAERIEFPKVSRDKLSVLMVGDVAVSSGILKQQVRVVATGALVDMNLYTTQIWRQSDGVWRQYVFHATSIA